MAFDNTLGAGYIGCTFVSILYGVTCVQTFIYSQNCKNDSKLIKSMVAVLWVLDTLHALFAIMALYWYTITHFADPTVVIRIPWMISGGTLLLTPISDVIVRTFFVYRIWILSRRNKLLVFPLVFFALIVFASGLAFGIKSVRWNTFSQFAQLIWLLYFGLGLLFFVDGYVTVSLNILLYRSRRGFNARTDGVINTIMLYTINTGLLTSLTTLACLITYAASPTNYAFLALYFPLSKLYLNAFLATLNARDSLRSNMSASTPLSFPLSTTSSAVNSQARPPMVFKTYPHDLESGVTIEQEVYITSDATSSRHGRDES